MRILHAINPSRMAGAETFLCRLMSRVGADQWQQRAIMTPSPATEEFRAKGVECFERAIGGKANPTSLLRLRSAAAEFKADLVHSHLSSASWWSGWLESVGGPPSIGHVHGFTSAAWHTRQSHLIACSGAVKEDLIAKGIPGDRVTVMNYPTDPGDIAPQRSAAAVRSEFGVDAETPVIGTFAHLSIKKGYRELVEAAAVVLRQQPTVQFWCFGDGPLRGEIESRAAELGIAKQFRLIGFRRDVADLMQAIDVMALPSHREPFGLVYVEAALCGTPSIASRAGGTSEIIEHGQTGWLVPPKQPSTLAEAILESLEDRSRTQLMGTRGRELCLDRFGWPRYVQQLKSVYEQVLGIESTQPKSTQPLRAAA